MLITESYRELNRELHQSRPDYGTSGKHYAQVIRQIMDAHRTYDVLDYGCGKRTLQSTLGVEIANYDPALLEFAAPPAAADVVACTDVLEHIEPECLQTVLADLRRLTKKVAFLTIATGPAKKNLADGRNAHLIQQDARWWLGKLWDAGFRLKQFADMDHELLVTVE